MVRGRRHLPPDDRAIGRRRAKRGRCESHCRGQASKPQAAIRDDSSVAELESNWRRFGPAGLMIVAAMALALTPANPNLSGRRIMVYDDGATDWTTADPGTVPPGRVPRYGLLPALVESLGGEFIRSRDLADLEGADVLIVLPPGSAAWPPIPNEIQSRIWQYVSGGGRMIVAGEPETNLGVDENVLNDLLTPTAMSFRDDTANSLTERWEDNLDLRLMPLRQAAALGERTSASIARLPSASLGRQDRCSWDAGPGTNWAPIPTGPMPCPTRRAIVWATWSLRRSRTQVGERWSPWMPPPA